MIAATFSALGASLFAVALGAVVKYRAEVSLWWVFGAAIGTLFYVSGKFYSDLALDFKYASLRTRLRKYQYSFLSTPVATRAQQYVSYAAILSIIIWYLVACEAKYDHGLLSLLIPSHVLQIACYAIGAGLILLLTGFLVYLIQPKNPRGRE